VLLSNGALQPCGWLTRSPKLHAHANGLDGVRALPARDGLLRENRSGVDEGNPIELWQPKDPNGR
jgi:hypothetical protein